MRNARAFTLTDLLALIVLLTLLLAVAAAAGGPPARANPLPNYAAIAQAAGAYRNDNQNRLPFTLTYKRGTTKSATSGGLYGWCSWQWAGKNNLGRWAGSSFHRGFDVEAADRPMNAYLYPGTVFEAPPPPATLPADDPARNQQAAINRDPYDKASHGWNWPASEPAGLSSYIDVGTSYHTNMIGVYSIPGDYGAGSAGFEKQFQAFNELLAAGIGFNPSRYVWLSDEFATIVPAMSPGYTVKNGRGDINKSAMLYLDGHAGYEDVTPQVFKTQIYSLVYEE